MTQRIYTFYAAGFIPGVPGVIPGGHQVLVDEDSHQVLALGPIGEPLAPGDGAAAPSLAEPDQAPGGDQPSGAGATKVKSQKGE
jgi:hypothetical protein